MMMVPGNNTKPSLEIIANVSISRKEKPIEEPPQITPTTFFNESDLHSSTPEMSGTIFPLHDTIEISSSSPSQIIPTEATIPEDRTATDSYSASSVPDNPTDSVTDPVTEISPNGEDLVETISTTEIPVDFRPTVETEVRAEFQGKLEPVGISVGQKESVFMRMSNRIKALEINMSLSSQYLQELSQRYRRQMEEMQRAFNRTIGTLNDTARKAAERDLKQQDVLNNLQLQVANLTQTVDMLLTERTTVYRQMLETHACLMVVEAIVMMTIMSLCVRRSSSSAGHQTPPAKETAVVPAARVSKRRSSVDSCSPPVARKVKRRSASEEALNAGELLIIEPCPVVIDPMLKAKKKHRRRSKAIHRSNSNPTAAAKNPSASHPVIPPTSLSDSHIQSSDKFLSYSARCENCNDHTCTVSKVRDRRANGTPFQNLTNGSVVRPQELKTTDNNKPVKGKLLSFKKFQKFLKRDSI